MKHFFSLRKTIKENMIVSARKQFIFVHIPKTAGSSIFQALRQYNDAPDTDENRHLDLETICKRYAHLGNLSGNPAFEEGNRSHSTPGRSGKFFKFAFVRNPWDRIVSMYFYRLQNREIPRDLSFFDFVINRKNYPFGLHREQVKLLADDNGQIAMDFIGRFENLREDWVEVQNRIDVKADLPRLKQTSHNHYRHYYNREIIDEVARMYPKDIDFFGYRF